MLINRQAKDSVDFILLLLKFNVDCFNTSEGVVINVEVVFFVCVAKELISKRLSREGKAMLVNRVIYIVAPLRPPRSTDQELAVTQASKVGLVHERIVSLPKDKPLVVFARIINRGFKVLEH